MKSAMSIRIRTLRKRLQLTQKQLAEATGLSLPAINSYESGRREPNSKAMAALEHYFNVSGRYLRGETNIPVERIVRPETGGAGQAKKYPQVGETLSSGYTVIANYHNRHVLAHNELAPQPYAIWDLDQDGETVTGRYFCEVSRAEKRFAEICFPWFDDNFEGEIAPIKSLVLKCDAEEMEDMLLHPAKAHQAIRDLAREMGLEKEGPE